MYSLKQLTEKVQSYFSEEKFIGNPPELYAPIEYTLREGGKRIRPVLMLAAVDLFGGDIEEARYAAIGIETFHNFTLLHDDLMDKSPMRRGKPTVYRKWNENTAILSGDAMNILAWRYFLKKPHKNLLPILQTFEQTSMEICEGQQYDMNFETRNDVTIPEYMEMIRLKTAVLLGSALRIGALYADAAPADIDHLYDFGIKTGLAFQLRDDLLDSFGDETTFGKKTGTDIKDNKKTYLMLRALAKGDNKQRERLTSLFKSTPDDPSDKIAEVLSIYRQLDIHSDVEEEISILHNEAVNHLKCISCPDQRKSALLELATSLLNRNI